MSVVRPCAARWRDARRRRACEVATASLFGMNGLNCTCARSEEAARRFCVSAFVRFANGSDETLAARALRGAGCAALGREDAPHSR
jgi:hypothetical protein